MAGEYNANIERFVSTVVVRHPRLGIVRMDTSDYDPAICGEILESATVPPNTPGHADAPNKDPHFDDQGRRIAELRCQCCGHKAEKQCRSRT
jgi:hypothetical protein